MGLQINTVAIETLESRTLMASTGADCVHAGPAEPGAQGYKVQHFDRPSVGGQRAPSLNAKFSMGIAHASQIEAALIRAAMALANQLRGGGVAAENPPSPPQVAPPPVKAPEPSAPTVQSFGSAIERVTAQMVVAPPQIVIEVAALASSSIRQEVLSADLSSKVSAAASVISAAPVIAATPIFSSAYAASVSAFNNIESTIAAVAPEVSNIVANPAATIASVIAPAAKIFNFAEMGSPLVFLGDAIANFADESASVPAVLAAAPTNETAWIITGVVAAVDTAVIVYYFRRRANRQKTLAGAGAPFSRTMVNELDSLEDLG